MSNCNNTLTTQELLKTREAIQRQICADPELWPSAKVIGIAISWHTNANEGGEARPGIKTLAKAAAISVRAAYVCLEQLESRRHYQIEHRGGSRRSNIYLPTPWRELLECNQGTVTHTSPDNQGTVKYTSLNGEAYFKETVNRTSPEPFIEPIIEQGVEPRSLASPDGSLTRLEKQEGGREGQERTQGEEIILEPVAKPSSLNTPDQSDVVQRDQRPTMEELRVKLNMPDLGKSVRRMN